MSKKTAKKVKSQISKKRRGEPVALATPDFLAEQKQQLRDLLPQIFTDSKLDVEKLKEALGETVDERPERYSFTWAGKRQAIQELQKPTWGTLVPAEKESVNFDSTQNIFIEGENLEVLKLLYKSYFGRVKMIYVDPPYNTGGDFIYPDNFADPKDAYLKISGQMDAEGNLLTSNPETSGRYHSAWLSMMYPRLFLARQLLRDDGVIFVSIDDHEVHNLRMLMNEVFGEENFLATITWKKRSGPPNDKIIGEVHEYIHVYARDSLQAEMSLMPRPEESKARFENPDNDSRGVWVYGDLSANAKGGRFVPSLYYEIVNPSNAQKHLPPEGACWRFSKEKVNAMIQDGRIIFGENGKGRPKMKRFLSEVRDGFTVPTIWEDVATNTNARTEINEIFGSNSTFETPKPVDLLKRIIEVGTGKSGIVLDFFSGSSTTAHATLSLNRADGGNRTFICVQLPEQMETPKEIKGGVSVKSIADIGRERIVRVLAAMSSKGSELPLGRVQAEDLGCSVFKLAPSNFKPWTSEPNPSSETLASSMELFNDPLTEGWKEESVIYEIAVKEGFNLTSRVERVSTVKANKVFTVTDAEKEQSFRICLDNELKSATVKELNLKKDDLFICRDVGIDDKTAANLALQCRLKTI